MTVASSAGGLCDLPLPDPASGESWDSSYRYADAVTNRSSICAHAVAHGSLIAGCNDTQWLAWKTSLAPHQVTQVISNADGSVIAAATDGGTVSLLRGSDGEKLATRKVSSCEGQSARISFVGGAHDGGDALLIEAPNSSDESTNLILVSNIHGKDMQNEHPEKVAEAVRRTKIQSVKLEASNDLLAFSGHFQDSDIVRLVAYGSDGTLSVFDYTISQNLTVIIKSGIALVEGSEGEWTIDYEMGFRVQDFHQKSYSICSGFSEEGVAAAFWFDPATLETVCRFQLPKLASQTQRPKIMAVEAVQSFSDKSALAMALVVKSHSDLGTPSSTVYVIQIAVEETMGLFVLSEPHIVYTIPIETPIFSVALAPLNSRSPYSFRLKIWQGSDQFGCKAFVSASPAIGLVRFLIQRGDFDRADIVMAEKGEKGVDALINTPFASFHPSEVVLKRLQRLVEQGNVCDPVAVEKAQACLRRLASGALSGEERGLQLLLGAPQIVIESYPNPSIAEFTRALSVVASTLESVARALPLAQANLVEAKQSELQDRVTALNFIDAQHDRLRVKTSMKAIRSLAHLVSILIVEHQFGLAEMVWKSDLKTRSSKADFLVSSMVKVSADVAPKEYLRLLQDIVLPSLTINHELLPPLRAWCCRTADALDDGSEAGLESAIQLLEAVDKGTKRLQVQIHSSFATYTPFVERLEGRKAKRSPRNTNSSQVSESSREEKTVAFGSISKSSKDQGARSTKKCDGRRPIPTVLEMSRLKGGATKSNFGFVFRAEQLHDDNEGRVQEKLWQAKCLQQARWLGMDEKTIGLGTFAQKGGALFCAVELASLFSKNVKSHDDRLKCFLDRLQPFCERFAVSYDRALLDCAFALCRGKDVTELDIQESTSIARCCQTEAMKCQGALAVLRAALFCGLSATWLSKLSKDAVGWASADSGLKSELEEASRLLRIHSIVIRYCGSGARELFRVDNSRHAVRLLEFVAQHVEKDSVLGDALSLCEAFSHLSPLVACRLIFQKAVLIDDFLPCAYLMRQLFERDKVLSAKTLVSVVSYADEILSECSKEIHMSTTNSRRLKLYKKRAVLICSNVSALIMVALEYTRTLPLLALAEIDCFEIDGSLEKLRDAFNSIHELRSQHNIYISLSDMRSTDKIIHMTSILLLPIVDARLSENVSLLRTRVQRAKRGCTLMVSSSMGDFNDIWIAACTLVVNSLIHKRNDDGIISFVHALDIFQGSRDDFAARACLSVAMALCSRAPNHSATCSSLDGMKRIARATSLLLDEALQITTSQLLPSVVSLGALLDGASQLFTRADEGKGEVFDSFRESLQSGVCARTRLFTTAARDDFYSRINMHPPSLHRSWHVGDGLLLPPEDILPLSVHFCQELLGIGRAMNSETFELYRFVADRGAHCLSLRVLISSAIATTSSPRIVSSTQTQVICDNLSIEIGNTMNSLVERSLGGTGSGIMNGIIDSQLAASFLLLLPTKLAFKVYKSALPASIKSGAFDRVFTLAHIGRIASEGENLEQTGFFGVGWKRQKKFASQCRHLATRATWWKLLQDFEVSFDPQLFEENAEMTSSMDKLPQAGSMKAESKYAESLLAPFIASMTKRVGTEELLNLGTMFANTFGFSSQVVLQKHIEFLLSPPSIIEPEAATSGSSKRPRDIRYDLDQCQTMARNSLRLLPPTMRFAVLRRCLVALEGSENFGRDYERHGTLLTLYHDALMYVVDHDLSLQNQDSASFEAELELVDRRRDALAILTSFFQGDRVGDRPDFPCFFLPLPVPFGVSSAITNHASCSILGKNTTRDGVCFDPLQPLEKILSTPLDSASTAALAPLCIPLGLPQGYVHARSLIARFRHPINQKNFPSFDNDVVPVINRLKSSSDKALLAQWCSSHYTDDDEEKLNCLDLALRSAMQASTEVEQRRRHHSNGKDKMLEEQEVQALDNLKRIAVSRDALSDRLKVKTILRSSDSSIQGTTKSISEELIRKLDLCAANDPDLCPESVIECLLSEGSLLVAQTSLDPYLALSMKQFRSFSSVVHEACTAVSEQHSHIRPIQCAKRFARRWLFHGDKATRVDKKDSNIKVTTPSVLLDIEEDNTVDFVMDLADLQEDDWGGDVGQKSDTGLRFTSEEEPSALKATAAREQSEKETQQAALRIAFVLAFEDCDKGLEPSALSEKVDENTSSAANKDKGTSSKKRGRLLSRVDTKRDSKKDSQVVQLSQELLQIVFAKSGSSPKLFSQALFEIDNADSSTNQEGSVMPKTITFAMRHRALRAASILCPQEALEQVVRDEGFLDTGLSLDVQECPLQKCTFGAFVAKEIEEMGLPLPHSDLGQLSSMHFLSYARTLWRHRDGDVKGGSRGRLLLLLVEMSLKEKNTDQAFVASLLSQMNQMQLPRTLLLATERVVDFQNRAQSPLAFDWVSLQASLLTLTKAAFSELTNVSCSDIEDEDLVKDILETFERLGNVLVTLFELDGRQHPALQFVESLRNISNEALPQSLLKDFADLSTSVFERLGRDLTFRSSPNSSYREPLSRCQSDGTNYVGESIEVDADGIPLTASYSMKVLPHDPVEPQALAIERTITNAPDPADGEDLSTAPEEIVEVSADSKTAELNNASYPEGNNGVAHGHGYAADSTVFASHGITSGGTVSHVILNEETSGEEVEVGYRQTQGVAGEAKPDSADAGANDGCESISYKSDGEMNGSRIYGRSPHSIGDPSSSFTMTECLVERWIERSSDSAPGTESIATESADLANNGDASNTESDEELQLLETIRSTPLTKIPQQIPTVDELCDGTAPTEGSGSYSIEGSNAVGGARPLGNSSTSSIEQNGPDAFADEEPSGKSNGVAANAGSLSSGQLHLNNSCGSERFVEATALEEKSKNIPSKGSSVDSKEEPVTDVEQELGALSSNQPIAQGAAIASLFPEEHTILFEAVSEEELLWKKM